MKKFLCTLIPLLILSACSENEAKSPAVSRADVSHVQGMSYEEFRNSAINAQNGDDGRIAQKRFILLDRDNNGVLSPNEFSED